MSETPRTDAYELILGKEHGGSITSETKFVSADFARQLERELAEARVLTDTWIQKHDKQLSTNVDLCRDLAAANTVIARMREALKEAQCVWPGEHRDSSVFQQICAALSLTPATVRDEVELQRKLVGFYQHDVHVIAQLLGLKCWALQEPRFITEAIQSLQADLTALRTRAEKAEADVAELRGLLALAHCPQCDGSGVVVSEAGRTEYVTADMARDAGDPSLEGSVYRTVEHECEQCEWCARRDAARQPTPQPHEEGKR